MSSQLTMREAAATAPQVREAGGIALQHRLDVASGKRDLKRTPLLGQAALRMRL